MKNENGANSRPLRQPQPYGMQCTRYDQSPGEPYVFDCRVHGARCLLTQQGGMACNFDGKPE